MADTKQGLVYFMTGGCGFLGQHLLRVLLEKGEGIAEVRLFDKQIDSSLQDRTTDELSDNKRYSVSFSLSDQVKVVVIQGDITDYSSVLEASRGADLIIHTASLVDVWYRVPEKVIYAVNVQGTQHIIDACVENSIQYLVYTSSMEVVGPNIRGDTFKRGNEDTKYNIYHEMPYPKSKAKAEKMVLQSNGIKVKAGGSLYTCALRPTGIYGEHHQLMKEFYQSGVKTGGWLICGVPKNTEHGRVYAGNVAWMHLIAAQSLRDHPEKLGGECYFCYDDSPYLSYEDFNMQFLSAFNFRKLHIPLWALWAMTYVVSFLHWALKPVYNFTPLLNHYTLAVACTSFTVSTDKAERHFNYQPLYSWEECRSRTQRWVDTFPLEITDSKNE